MSFKGVYCPRCGQYCRMRATTQVLTDHKTDQYAFGQPRNGRRREWCVYSGGTLDDAKNGITPLQRKMMNEEVMPQ